MVNVLEIISTYFYISLVQDTIVRYAKKQVLTKFFVLYNRDDSFESFLIEKRPWDFRGY